ncbi:GPW/gp25 family protein [Hoeflea ulvae]|uniref:GPW/gp25 family protein n=1 Tax=Hoeflea ulvae TaxID=2983764 RepID=A0ABT3YH10_9HYPH|nr:GPW/gp25 family protein [Hoeflea ulvae]MCY0095188.1 GPW/gp25 family protein [Hoeflea ulvae]
MMSAADRLRRKGLSETEVRQQVMDSLIDVVNTIDLQSSVDLTGLDYASKSILNYGLYDISHLTSEDMSLATLEQNVVAALLCYEPRINKETLRVRRDTQFNDVDQKLRLSIYAEVSFLNLEVPIEFVAEIDIGASKVSLLKASTLS